MSNISSLNTSLLQLVFDHIDSAKDLAQCRTVCKSWNYPAERSMFGTIIKIQSEATAFKLYRHLFKDTSNTTAVKHLHFSLEGEDLPYSVEQLMDLAITPNIRELSGTVNAKRFYDILYEIVSNPSVEYKYLDSIPEKTDDHTYGNQVKLKFKDYTSVLSVVVDTPSEQDFMEVLAQLDHFPKLQTLILIGGVRSPLHLEIMLRHTSRLNHLSWFAWRDTLNEQPIMSKAALAAWASGHVKKELTLRSLTICEVVRPDMLEFLMFKYPNITQIHFHDAAMWLPAGEENLNVDIMDRILDALKPIKSKSISLKLPDKTQMKVAFRFADNRPEDIVFDIKERNSVSSLRMLIESDD